MRDLLANGRSGKDHQQLIMIRRYLSPAGSWWRAWPTRRSAGWTKMTAAVCSTSPTGLRRWARRSGMPAWRTAVLADEINNLMAEATTAVPTRCR